MSFALNEPCTSRAPNWRRRSAIVSDFTLVSFASRNNWIMRFTELSDRLQQDTGILNSS